MSEWISIDDELPKIPRTREGVIVDVWVEFNIIIDKGHRTPECIFGYIDNDEGEFWGNGCDLSSFTVTHWMYPPSPPKKQEKQEEG